MLTRWKVFFLRMFRKTTGTIRTRSQNTYLTLVLPPTIVERILDMKLQPEDDITQVLRDALMTHNEVIEARQSGGRLFVHRGAEMIPLDLEHLIARAPKASFGVIRGGRGG